MVSTGTAPAAPAGRALPTLQLTRLRLLASFSSLQGEADSALDHLWTKKRAEIGQQA